MTQLIKRAHLVVCENPLNGMPAINYRRQRVLTMDDGTRHVIETLPDTLVAVLTPETAGVTFPILDPETDEPTGQTMTALALYNAIRCHYLATEAAAALPPPDVPAVPPTPAADPGAAEQA